MKEQVYSTNEILTAVREASTLVKQSEATLTKSRVGNNPFIRKDITIILKSDINQDIIIRTCDEDTIDNISVFIKDYKDVDATRSMKHAINDHAKSKYGFTISDIIAYGSLDREFTKSKLESYIDVNVVIGDKFDNKKLSKKAYKCFVNEDHHLTCNCSHIIHEDAGSSFNCLISTKLKFYNHGVIYKVNK